MVAADMSAPPAWRPGSAADSAAGSTAGNAADAGAAGVLAEYGHLIDPLTGIVPELRRDTSGPDFQYVFGSGPNLSIPARTVDELRARARVHSGGRGITEADAKAGALCEAVERHCGTRHGDEAVTHDSFRNLAGIAVHPADCLLFDERQYSRRAELNASCPPLHHVPEPFDDCAATDWSPVWSLTTGERRLLPTAMLYYRAGPVPASAQVLADSNGCAAGASIEDAIMRGFLELVERDAVALWWYNQTRQPDVGLSVFDDPWINGIERHYGRLGREVWLLDVTSDLGIPVLAAVSRRSSGESDDIVLGFGAHPDPRVAARRALTEAGQLLGSVSDTPAARTDPYLASWRAAVSVRSHPCLLPAPVPSVPALREGRGEWTLADFVDVARDAGLDVLVLDQTRPDIGMPVARVIVPGLRHFWPRFAPGRLFDVPVRMGRLNQPTDYDTLNPFPLLT
jgi:ribosomal protein S12 methylthiotransferase accessory factor